MGETDLYIEKVGKAILAIDKSISQVQNLNFVKIIDYSKENLDKIVELSKKKEIKAIELLEGGKAEELIIILKFSDRNDNNFLVLVYDNENLWQDPQIIQMFSL